MNFFSRMFGDKKKTGLPSPAASDVIVADFGNVIATRAPAPGCVADVSELPYPKKDIRVAILITLALTRDQKMQQHLMNAYVMLASWQVGVGPTHKGLDATKLDRTKSAQELAKEVLARTDEMKKWQPLMDADQKALLDDLRTASPGFGKLGGNQ